jgi:hypothetical protein
MVEVDEAEDEETSHRRKAGSIIRIRSWDKSLILIVSVRPHRNLQKPAFFLHHVLVWKVSKTLGDS